MSSPSPVEISASEARRIALGAQGFRDRKPSRRVDRRHLRRVMGRIGLLQLDSVPAVIRTQYMPLFSRLGAYDPDLLDQMAYADDEWFEAWSHEASLLAVADEPLLRWHKARSRQGETWRGLAELAEREPQYVADVLAQVHERPLAPGELSNPRPRDGNWWGSRSIGSLALDWLFRVGEVGVRRRPGFVKEFDLLDRIVPEEIRSQPTPSEVDSHRHLLDRAGVSFGIATAADLIDYYRLPKRTTRARIDELVEHGRLIEASVEGWDRPAYLHVDAVTPRKIDACTLLSPFDPVVWFRERAERLFNFRYRIEIYTPAAKRVYGYYVLPFLLEERLAARVDLKTDRSDDVLRVFGAFTEPGEDHGVVAPALKQALDELAVMVGVDRWVVSGRKGDLIGPLRALIDAHPTTD